MSLRKRTDAGGRVRTNTPPRRPSRWVRALTVLAAFAPPAAYGATDTDTMTVTATVISSCNVTANDLAFGDYDPVAASPLTASSTIEVTCTNGTGYEVALDEGVGSGATIATRKMTAGADTLNYSLYQDGAHATVWGETDGVNTVSGVGTGAAENLDVYGLIPAAQTAPVGAYSDTITVTVTY